MRINPEAIDRVQARQLDEGIEILAKRLSLDLPEIISDALSIHGAAGPVFLSGLSTGIDLGLELAKSQDGDPHPVEAPDEFLESLPESMEST